MSNSGGEHPIEKSGNEARQGVTPHMTRNVLVWGIVLVAIAFAILWWVWYA